MKINIYQINQGRDTQRLKFMGLDAVRKVLRSAEPDWMLCIHMDLIRIKS